MLKNEIQIFISFLNLLLQNESLILFSLFSLLLLMRFKYFCLFDKMRFNLLFSSINYSKQNSFFLLFQFVASKWNSNPFQLFNLLFQNEVQSLCMLNWLLQNEIQILLLAQFVASNDVQIMFDYSIWHVKTKFNHFSLTLFVFRKWYSFLFFCSICCFKSLDENKKNFHLWLYFNYKTHLVALNKLQVCMKLMINQYFIVCILLYVICILP
jgi:hypothetical protein